MIMLESLLKLLNGEKVDKVVWAADLDYWISGQPEGVIKKTGLETEIG